MMIKTLVSVGFTAVLFQFATPVHGLTAEPAKTVEEPDPVAAPPPTGFMPTALISLGGPNGVFSNYAFLVDKKNRTLTVWQNVNQLPRLVGAWPVDLGKNPGDKIASGDRRTPEGIYFLQKSMDGHQVNFDMYGARIFTTDYPNPIDLAHHKSGHGIWLHAVPDTTSLTRGSHGCVVVRNTVIEGLSSFIEMKRTPLVIVEQAEYLSLWDWWILRKEILQDLRHWQEQVDPFAPSIAEAQILKQGHHFVVRLRQDLTAKTVYAQRRTDRFEVVAETYDLLPPALAGASQISQYSSRSLNETR